MGKFMDKVEIFNSYYDEYDQWFETHADTYKAEIEAIKMLLPSTTLAIDIGVGTGKFAKPLGITVGIEPSEKMAERAKSQGIIVIKAFAEDLPFYNNSFDVALMVTTICFVNDPQKAIHEAYRILNPQGCCIIAIVDKNSPLGKYYIKNKDSSKFYKAATFYSTDEIIDYMEKSGFVKFKFKQTLFDDENPFRIEDGYGSGSFVVIQGFK